MRNRLHMIGVSASAILAQTAAGVAPAVHLIAARFTNTQTFRSLTLEQTSPPATQDLTAGRFTNAQTFNHLLLTQPVAVGGTDPHEWWRINVTSNNGDVSYVQIAKVELYNDQYTRFDETGGATVTDSSHFSSQVGANTIDETYNEGGSGGPWTTAGSGTYPQTLTLQLTSAKAINAVMIRATTLDRNRLPATFDIQSSDDGSAWTTEWSVTTGATAWDDREARIFVNPGYTSPSYSGSPYGAHAYWRLMHLLSGGGFPFSCAEIEFRPTPSGSADTTGSAISDSDTGGFAKDNAFDLDNSTAWASTSGDFGYIGRHFGSAIECAEIAVRSRDASADQTVKLGCVQYSDDGIKWHTAWEVSSPSAWGTSEQRVFTDPGYV